MELLVILIGTACLSVIIGVVEAGLGCGEDD
jgi:hypothetical protein